MTEQQKINHLINRATFGFTTKIYPNYKNKTIKEVVEILFEESKNCKPFELANIKTFKFVNPIYEIERFKIYRKQQINVKIKLNNLYINHLVYTKAQLREKMAFFWHDHFACNVLNPIKTQKQINTIRANALDYFGDLLIAISKDPAMIEYLNGQLNVKRKPNEDFGREILELFTLGEGNYTEEDIKNCAKAFTGYGYDGKGNFYLYDDLHDKTEKVFMGKKGKFKGDDIINIILRNKKCGEYITSKIYKYFTGVDADKSRLKKLSSIFYNSGYHISTLLKAIFTADWFYEKQLVGTRIKSPIELTVSVRRLLKIHINKAIYTYRLQKKLDQIMFEPPNVSGWIDGKNWVHLSTITERLTLAESLINDVPRKVIKNPQKISDEGDEPKFYKPIKANAVNGLNLLQEFLTTEHPKKEILALAKIIFTCETLHINNYLNKLQNKLNKKTIKFSNAIVLLLTLPEFQLN